MSEHENRPPLDEHELVRLAGATPVAPASAAARERARRAFLTGLAPRRRPDPVAYVPLAIAAGLLALVMWGMQPEERWTVLAATQPGATIGGAPAAPGAQFVAGVVATDEGAELDVQLGERLRVRLDRASRAELPRGPGRWLAGSRRLAVERGEIFGTTQGEPLGFPLTLVTPEAEARILGTTFAVTRTELGPCFCLYDGELEVTARGRSLRVPEGKRVQVYVDGRAPEVVDLTDRETMKLQMIREAGLAPPSEP